MKTLGVNLTYLATIEVPDDMDEDLIEEYIKDNTPKYLPGSLNANLNDIEWDELRY